MRLLSANEELHEAGEVFQYGRCSIIGERERAVEQAVALR